MQAIKNLESMKFHIAPEIDYEYCGGGEPSPEYEKFLAELSTHKYEAISYLINQNPNIHISSTYRTSITKGLLNGESAYRLLLQAIKCISEMTGDKPFYTENYDTVKSVYGEGLLETAPLEVELEEVRSRLEKLTRPELPQNDRRVRAVKAHRERESQLIKMLGESTE